MDVYKNFVQLLRRKELEDVSILLFEDQTQNQVREYVRLLRDVPFEDNCYYIYYGEIKIIVSSFVKFFNSTINDAIVEADRCINEFTKDDLLCLVERTIMTHHKSQIDFGNAFLPVQSPEEKEIYEELNMKYEEYIGKLFELKEKVYKLGKQDKVEEFSRENFPMVVAKTSEMFDFVFTYISMVLVDCVKKLRVSLEEIHLRLYNNLVRLKEENQSRVKDLMQQLYESNKDRMHETRRERQCFKTLAEVEHQIQSIETQIQIHQADTPDRVEKEVLYWKNRIEYFNKIANNVEKLQTAHEEAVAAVENYNSKKCTEFPGHKAESWKAMGNNFHERLKLIDEKLQNEARCLVTFLAVRGTDRIFKSDNIGPYYEDEFGHQVYVFHDGLAVYHVNCEGDLINLPKYAHYYDKFGRYINLDGERVYQCAPCTSQYKLDKCNLLVKVSKDCGHSEHTNDLCKVGICDPKQLEILPEVKEVNFVNTLDTETVNYLWGSLGYILPEALHDVAMVQPNNPIHFLAHKLIYHKYRRSKTELEEKKKEAQQYRTDVYRKRTEEAIAKSKAWRSKLARKPKPEDFDEREAQQTYAAQIAQQMFIEALNKHDDDGAAQAYASQNAKKRQIGGRESTDS